MSYRTFFGLTREPFSSDLNLNEILQTQELLAVKERFDYALRIGAMALVTGDIGSGKSTALRYAMGQLHPSEYATFYLTASSGSILELYRQILAELGLQPAGASRANLTKLIKREIQELVLGKKMKVSGGIFRKANHLARGVLIAAAKKTVRHSYGGPCPSCLHRSVLKPIPKPKDRGRLLHQPRSIKSDNPLLGPNQRENLSPFNLKIYIKEGQAGICSLTTRACFRRNRCYVG